MEVGKPLTHSPRGVPIRALLVDEVLQEFRNRILTGIHKPGETLRQERLAQDLEESRTPVREDP